jgi:GT2 family glycosyltransferase
VRLCRGPYVSACSLFNRETFLEVGGFDESLPRLHDWDLFLRLAERGYQGTYVPEVLYHAYYLPGASVTSDHDYQTARRAVQEKHGL